MQFKFKAKNFSGQTIEGEREAANRQELALALRNEGFTVVSLDLVNKFKGNILEKVGITSGRVKLKEKIIFAGNLSAMIEAGLPLSRALTVFERQTSNKFFKKVISDILNRINTGKPLSLALSDFPSVFPDIFVSMVKAGEESGNLVNSLKLVQDQLQKSYELRRKIIGAMIYPSIIITMIFAVGAIMMIFVVPTLVATFEDLGVELPLSTRVVIAISDFVSAYYPLVALGLIIFFALFFFGRKTRPGRQMESRLMLSTPFIGTLVRQYNSAMVMRTLSSLVAAGVSLTDSIQITSSVVGNTEYKQVMEGSIEAIQRGVSLSQVFKAREDIFLPLVGEMADVGEESGKLSEMLLRGAMFFEGEVDSATKNMSTIIEPVLLVFIGLAVGLFALSMIGPMYSLTEAI